VADRVECPVCHNKVGRRYGRLVKHTPCDDVRYGNAASDPYDRAMGLAQRKGTHLIWTGYLMHGAPTLQVRQPGRSRTPTGGGRTSLTVRRIVWRKHHGEPPPGAMVVVTCREPLCIAPAHLTTKGRAAAPVREARRQRRAELEEARNRRDAAIAADYAAGVLLRTIKAHYRVDATMIYRAVRKHGGTADRGGGRYVRAGTTRA
jgi:hypothetical protein